MSFLSFPFLFFLFLAFPWSFLGTRYETADYVRWGVRVECGRVSFGRMGLEEMIGRGAWGEKKSDVSRR